MNVTRTTTWAAVALFGALPLAAQQMTTTSATRSAGGPRADGREPPAAAYHRALTRMAGTWDVKIEIPALGSSAAREFDAEAVIQPTMDEYYVEENLSGGDRAHPYRAHGVMGYNEASGNVESVRFDNTGAGLRTSTGTLTLPGDEFVLEGNTTDPMTGRTIGVRTVVKILSNDEFVVTDHRMVDGRERQVMKRLYSRK